MSINEMMYGQIAYVSNITAIPSLKRRLMDIGFTRGTEVSIVSVAPMSDPIVIRVRNSNICIRRAEASSIEVSDYTGHPGCIGHNCRRRGRRVRRRMDNGTI